MVAPSETAPASTMIPSKMARICRISARWLMVPEWPPPPAPMQMRPSTPAAIAFSAKRMDVMSCMIVRPASWARRAMSVGIAADGDQHLHAETFEEIEVSLELVIRKACGQVDGDRRCCPAGSLFVRLQVGADVGEPGREGLEVAGVLARQAADHPGLAGLADQIRAGHQEHRRADRRQDK